MSRRAVPLLFFCVAALLGACADKPLAPIEDRSGGGTAKAEQRYTVLRGDTLFSIAFRYGLDFRRLAAANAIAVPYTIYPGQKLRLAEAEPPDAAPGKPSPPAAKTPVKTAAQSATPDVVKSSASPAGSSASRASVSTPKAEKPVVSKASRAATNTRVSSWRWPAGGRVVRRFEKNLHKGVDIGGNRGDPVQATAGGRVVYAGSGIAGYGLMLIVRHNDEYLSAYGHNDSLLVGEGDVVRAGQKIAERGSSGTDSVKLHFEIRRQGRPVDPLRLLPPR